MGGGARCTRSLLELLAILEKGLDRKISVSYADWRPADQRVYISGIQVLLRLRVMDERPRP